jgi:ketosteroid isomerase-like protein
MQEMNTATLVHRLADLEEIRELARRYAHYVWQQDAAGAVDLFTVDGEMHTGDRPPIVGRAALAEMYRGTLSEGKFQPFVHNHVVELNGDAATGTCYLDLRAVHDGQSMIGAGYYEDVYVRVDGVWKFRSRRLNLLWYVPIADGWVKTKRTG